MLFLVHNEMDFFSMRHKYKCETNLHLIHRSIIIIWWTSFYKFKNFHLYSIKKKMKNVQYNHLESSK